MSVEVEIIRDGPIPIDMGGMSAESTARAEAAYNATVALQAAADGSRAAAEAAADIAVFAAEDATDQASLAALSGSAAMTAETAAETAETGAETALAAVLAALAGTTLTTAILKAATRTLLAALDHSLGMPAVLLEGRRAGIFKFDTSNLSTFVTADPQQGIYVAPSSDTTGASGAWVRIFNGLAETDWWGAIPDWNGTTGTDLKTAFDAAQVTLQARSTPITEDGAAWWLPEGLRIAKGRYYSSGTLSIKLGTGFLFDMTVAEIHFPANTIMLVVNADTTDIEATRTSGPFPSGARIIAPRLRGGGGSNRTKHGIWVRTVCSVEHPNVKGAAGDGIRVGNSNGQTDGNQNATIIYTPFVQACGGDGIHTEGGDANAVVVIDPTVTLCGRFGLRDKSFLGGRWYGGVVENCGVDVSPYVPGYSFTPAFVYQSGHNWAVVDGQETSAATVTPSAARPDVWIDMGAAASGDPSVPDWFNGIVMEAGGAIGATGAVCAARFTSPHIESYSVAQLGTYALLDTPAGAPIIRGGQTRICAVGIQQFGPGLETVCGNTVSRIGGNGPSMINEFASWWGEDGHQWRWFRNGGYLRLRNEHLAVEPFQINDATGRHNTLDVETAYYFNGVKVVGARQPTPTTLAEVINVLTAHGLAG